jgi:choline kinase
MKAVMLAAGSGTRLGETFSKCPPKLLLRFGGKSLLRRHIEILKRRGISELVLGIGYRQEEIEQEIDDLGAGNFVRTVFNENFDEGNIVTLWTLRDELCYGGPVLLMDGDVLYDERLIQRLIVSRHKNCVLLDRSFTPGDEPVKLCIRDGEIVEFRKWLSADFDFCGESVGFFRLSAGVAGNLIAQTRLYLDQGRRWDPYEEAIRDLILTSPPGTFAYEDVTGLPWIEIDFAADVERANSDILPRFMRLEPAERGRPTTLIIGGEAGREIRPGQ